VTLLEVVFWVSLAALLWTHLPSPAFMALLAKVRPRRIAKADIEPTVAVIVPEPAVLAEKVVCAPEAGENVPSAGETDHAGLTATELP